VPTPIQCIITLLTLFAIFLLFSFLINLAFNLKSGKVKRYTKPAKKASKPTVALKGAIIPRKKVKWLKNISR
jgi:hypothetical protein